MNAPSQIFFYKWSLPLNISYETINTSDACKTHPSMGNADESHPCFRDFIKHLILEYTSLY